MTGEIQNLIRQYSSKGILVDTYILLLYFAGTLNLINTLF